MRGHLELDGAAVQRAEALIVHLDSVIVAGKGDLQGLPLSATARPRIHSRQSNVSYVFASKCSVLQRLKLVSACSEVLNRRNYALHAGQRGVAPKKASSDGSPAAGRSSA